jgi:hypothetical protein
MQHVYPSELAQAAYARWHVLRAQDDPGPCIPREGALPAPDRLERLLSIAYQASLLQEEERAVRFRLFLGEPGGLPPGAGPPDGLHALRFIEPRPFDEHEIRRLSPAAKYHRALMGVRPVRESDYEIWGVLQSGPRWLQSARGGRAVASPVPEDAVVIRVVGPGRISIAVGDVILAELRGGRIDRVSLDLFQAQWLSKRFAPVHAELMARHEEAMQKSPGRPLDPTVTRKISQQLVKRLIATIRESHHGGTILFLPADRVANLLSGPGRTLSLKYAFVEGEPRLRYHSLIRRAMLELALAGPEAEPRSERVGWGAYQRSTRPSIATLDEAILEMSQLLAALGDVDGAVVLTDRFEVLGFGGEIVGSPSEIAHIRRGLDLEGTEFATVPIDGVGTRHRSAYRLCAQEPGAMAIVVSQDGGVQFVASHGGEPAYWEHVATSDADV